MTKLVIDASAAASWLLASQSTRPARELLTELDAYELAAPYVFHWEVGNLLVRQTWREPGFDLGEAFELLAAFEIGVAPPLARDDVRALAAFGAARRLTLFDASYLWLAMAHDAALASRDERLLEAARAASLTVFDLRELGQP